MQDRTKLILIINGVAILVVLAVTVAVLLFEFLAVGLAAGAR